MQLQNFLTVAALVAKASATFLYVSSYSGNITTLDLTESSNKTYSLSLVDSNNGCAPNASYITSDLPNLYCLGENIVGTNGTLASFKVDEDSGVLTKVSNSSTLGAPVHSTIWMGKNGTRQLLAVAHYAWGLSTWELNSADASFKLVQTFNFTQEKPGPDAARQAAPHPHQVIVDPSRRYFLVPDLGSDLVRVFYIDPKTLQITARPSIEVKPGSGPRHGAFLRRHDMSNGKDDIKFYLVSELANTLTSYNVKYLPENGGIQMEPITTMKTYGNNTDADFNGNAASEISIAPGKQIIVSNRNATFFEIENPGPKNATKVPSDTMATFSLSGTGDGTFKFGGLSPAGGSFPRHFKVNQQGTLVAVGLQNSERVAIYSYCKKTGKLGDKILASFEKLGAVTSIVWGK